MAKKNTPAADTATTQTATAPATPTTGPASETAGSPTPAASGSSAAEPSGETTKTAGTAGDGTGIEDEAAIAAALAVPAGSVSDPHAVADNTELADLAARAVGFKGLDENLNPPTMVNGQSVEGKKYDEASDTWVEDPNAASKTERKQDLIDRIARSFPNEGQRLVLEELCRLITDPKNTVDLPEGQPTGDKSTGSLRHDAQARGIVAPPVAPPVES